MVYEDVFYISYLMHFKSTIEHLETKFYELFVEKNENF